MAKKGHLREHKKGQKKLVWGQMGQKCKFFLFFLFFYLHFIFLCIIFISTRLTKDIKRL